MVYHGFAEGNLIGTDVTGTAPIDSDIEQQGVDALGSQLLRNVISGNQRGGVDVFQARLVENLIGTDITGSAAVANGGDGVWGSWPELIGNVISGNAGWA